MSQGHDWGGPGDRPDPSQGFVHNKVERCFKLALLRRRLLFLTSTTMGRSAWRSWPRSWPGTTFIPRGILNSPKKQSKYWLLVQNSHKYIYQGGASRHDQQSRQEQKWLNWFGGEDSTFNSKFMRVKLYCIIPLFIVVSISILKWMETNLFISLSFSWLQI